MQGTGRSPLGERGLKFYALTALGYDRRSLSPRRAWIEIQDFANIYLNELVALPSESVD